MHGFPDPHPAGPDDLADQVVALRLGGVSPICIRSVPGRVEVGCAQAFAFACRARSPLLTPAAALSKVLTPTRPAIAAVEVPWQPVRANSVIARE
ncbi:hypothetical protein [Streptomyces sp. NPDC006334]|uniref:hypothetical protein n=1 Tax=Streptomyces sp. NPDC006334 TaxID=3156754 RepID=UPI0033BF7CC7